MALSRFGFPALIILLVGLALVLGRGAISELLGGASPLPLDVRDTLFALGKSSSEVLRIAPDGRVIARASPPEQPGRLALVAGTDSRMPARAITVSASSNLLSSFDARAFTDAHHRTLDIKPNLVSPSPDGRHLAVAATGAGVVILLDAVTLDEVARATGLRGAHDLRFSANGDRLYVSTLGEARLVALDGADLTAFGELTLGGLPYGIDHTVRTPEGSLGLVVSPTVPRIWPVSLGDELASLSPIELPSIPSRGFVGPLGEAAWLPAAFEPAIHRIELSGIDPRQPGERPSVAERQTIRLGATPRTLGMEPFATTLLIATLDGLERMSADGEVLERIPLSNQVVRILPIESAVVSLLVHEDGSLSRQHAHAPLAPEPLEAPPVFAPSTAHALAFCHY